MANMCWYVGVVVVMPVCAGVLRGEGGGVIIRVRRGSVPFRRFVSELGEKVIPIKKFECIICP